MSTRLFGWYRGEGWRVGRCLTADEGLDPYPVHPAVVHGMRIWDFDLEHRGAGAHPVEIGLVVFSLFLGAI